MSITACTICSGIKTSDFKTILTPIGVNTLVGKRPDGDRVLCMHTRLELGKVGKRHRTFAKGWKWNGEKITEDCKGK